MLDLRVTRNEPEASKPGANRAPRTTWEPSRDRERSFRRDIAGLRAIAVLLVVIGHAGVPFLKGGYVGVDVFFVISGFLITANLARELAETGRIRFARFYSRRAVRLLPASIMVMLFTILATRRWASPMFAGTTAADALAAVGYAINMRLAIQGTHYFSANEPPTPMQHYWSLSVEEQFYLLWPMILVAGSLVWLRRRPSLRSARTVLAVVGLASFACCVWLTNANQPWAYFGLPTRAWELAAGAVIALSVPRLQAVPRHVAAIATWLGVVAIVTAGVLFSDTTAFPGFAALLPVGGAALVIAAGCAAPRRGAVVLLSKPPMQFIGNVSYSWYLWHWPVLILAPYVLGREPGLAVSLALVTAALVPAFLSLVLVEDRIRFQPVVRRRAWCGLVLGVSLSLLAANAAVFVSRLPTTVRGSGIAVRTAAVVHAPRSERLQRLSRLIAASARLKALPANLDPPVDHAFYDLPDDRNCIADFAAVSFPKGCDRFGRVDSSETMVLFGDSHARQWFDAVNQVARDRGLRLVSLVKGGCPASSALINKGSGGPYTECMRWRKRAIARINSLKPLWVVMSEREVGRPPLNYGGTPRDAWGKAWAATVRALQPSGARLAALTDTPDPRGVVVPDCLALHRNDIRRCNLPQVDAFKLEHRGATIDVLRAAGVTVIDTTPWFCAAGVCPAIIGNTVVYRGSSHVSATYTQLLVPLLERALPRGRAHQR